MLLPLIKKLLLRIKLNKYLSQRRLRIINQLVSEELTKGGKYQKILEVGCANGKDFVQLCADNHNIQITGIDVDDYGLRQSNFSMLVGDAEAIDFPDCHFDLTVSFGVLEHIQPIEKLAKVIREIDRVSKKYVIVVPSVSTLIEPHSASILWQLRSKEKKKPYSRLNYFSDEAWLQFEGFKMAKTTRFFHLPPLVSNLIIYKI
jgi:ubiquinone/menaquinone biosynthesis C-methylase UbiE